MTYPVRIVTPNAATEHLNAQQARQAVRNAMPALPNRDAISPLERLARSRVAGSPIRRNSALETALFEAAEAQQKPNRLLIWHMDAETGEFTGYSVGGKLNAEK